MRPVAVLLLVLVSIAIVCSFFFVPKIFAISLPYFYHQFWHRLTLLFAIATVFLGFAFYTERSAFSRYWIWHIIAVLLIGWFADELILFIRAGSIFFAFS